jgi:hypothetical protein
MPKNDKVPFAQVVHELTTKRMYLVLTRHVSRELMENMMNSIKVGVDVESSMAFATDSAIMEFKAVFQGCVVHEQVMETRTVPRTWRDAVKARWCPRWLIRKGWVHFNTDTIPKLVQHWHVCPHLHTHGNDAHLRFMSDDFRVSGHE